MSVIQSGCKRPERCVIGHPFNPPHMIPLVEVVGGNKTTPEATQQAMTFYTSIGKKPIYLRKEFPGHAAAYGGGKGGIHHFMNTLMDPMFALMKDLGNPQMTAQLKQTIIEGVMEEAGNRSVEKLAQEENQMLLGLLGLRTRSAAASM